MTVLLLDNQVKIDILSDAINHIAPEDLEDFIEASSELLEEEDIYMLHSIFVSAEYFYGLTKEKFFMTEIAESPAEDSVTRLLSQASTAQRTLEWYKQGQEVLTASQFATILKGARTRGHLVVEKSTPITTITKKYLCVRTEDIRAFDWGIRFEPVIKQIYENITTSKVADLGRLIHPTDKNLAASPDGLVTDGQKKGYLVEFKAPISRVITEEVPKDYWMQMQIQMEVANVNFCDYFEVQFSSPAGIKEWSPPPAENKNYGKGEILIIGDKEESQPKRYFYPKLDSSEEPELADDELILERIPWVCTGFNMKTVERSKSWFESMAPEIARFWLDVEEAKKGAFILPQSSRKRKAEECQITD